jgi:hypothetical protein
LSADKLVGGQVVGGQLVGGQVGIGRLVGGRVVGGRVVGGQVAVVPSEIFFNSGFLAAFGTIQLHTALP